MAYSNPCQFCGANLDPGEKCDCQEKAACSAEAETSGPGNNADLNPSNQKPKIKEDMI